MKTSDTILPAKHQLFNRRWQYAAAMFSMLAGWVHVYFAPEHFEEWVGYGDFFVAVSVYQLLFSLMIVANTRPRRELLWAGILGNVAIIALWVFSRTTGILLGPMAGEIEPIGVLDTISKIAELATIFCLIVLLRSRRNQVDASV